jgi:integrase/recombinase XerC
MLDQGLAPSTINRRLACLRSLVKLARTLGWITWGLEVPNCRHRPYRDTRGPSLDQVRRLLAALDLRRDAKGLRDRAMVLLLFDLALRRGEVVALDLEDLDLEGSAIDVVGKGCRQPDRLTLPTRTRAALAAWVDTRGSSPGPLFFNFDRARKGRRLTATSLYRIVRQLGRQVDVEARPHGLRHAAITRALDRTSGDVRAVQRFSRHRNLQTVVTYDDSRQDLGGKVAALVASEEDSQTP